MACAEIVRIGCVFDWLYSQPMRHKLSWTNQKPRKDIMKDLKNLSYIVVCSGSVSNRCNQLALLLAEKFHSLIWLAHSLFWSASIWNPFFSEGVENGLFNGDNILNEYKRKVRRLYNHVTETSTMNIEVETLTMLTAG